MEWLLKMQREINLYGYQLILQKNLRVVTGGTNGGGNGYYGRSDTLPAGVSDQKQNVVTAGGYYMGRFCLGNSGGYVVKKGVPLARFGAGDHAGIIKACKSVVNTSYAKSTIFTGAAWDTMLVFINGKRHGSGKNINVFISNSFDYPYNRYTLR